LKKRTKIILTILGGIGALILILAIVVGINQLIVIRNEQGEAIKKEAPGTMDQSYRGEDWPGWRGPHGNGVTTETGWTYDAEKVTQLWKVNVGKGYSSPSVVSDYLYISGNSDKNDTVYCLDLLTGKEYWNFSYPCLPGGYAGPRASPLIYKNLLFTISRDGMVYCLDAKTGKEIWSRHIAEEFSLPPHKWGYAGSPFIYNDILIINTGKGGIGIDYETGEIIWDNGGGIGGYASPVLFTYNSRDLVALFTAGGLTAVVPETGEIQWEYPWLTNPEVNAADPLITGTKAFISSYYGKGCALIDFSTNPPETIWKNNNMSSHFTSFYHKDGYIYGFDATPLAPFIGEFRCLDIKTGDIVWREKLGFGSFIVADTTFIIQLQPGTIKFAEVTHERYNELASLKIDRGVFWTAPVLTHGILLLRSSKGDLTAVSLQK
jgi:outer membrane protein assembly factor BamB